MNFLQILAFEETIKKLRAGIDWNMVSLEMLSSGIGQYCLAEFK